MFTRENYNYLFKYSKKFTHNKDIKINVLNVYIKLGLHFDVFVNQVFNVKIIFKNIERFNY